MTPTPRTVSRCSDCNAPRQEAPTNRRIASTRGNPGPRGRQVLRCPWTKASRYRIVVASAPLLILDCAWPKGRVDELATPTHRDWPDRR